MSSQSLPLAKRALRKQVGEVLRALPPAAVEAQASTLHSRIFSSSTYASSRSLSVYLSMPQSELSTAPIIERALSDGKKVFVPLITKGDRVMRMVRILPGELEEGLESDSWGIPVVQSHTKAGSLREDALDASPPLDLILLPGVAFSPTPSSPLFSRLGHGKGYYDLFVSSYRDLCARRACPAPKLVGLALNEQFLEEEGAVPVGDHDVPLDDVWRVGS